MTRITITLTAAEREALLHLAKSEYREIHSQAALIIRQELERQTFISTTRSKPTIKGSESVVGLAESRKSESDGMLDGE